jgi:hypothetical protein
MRWKEESRRGSTALCLSDSWRSIRSMPTESTLASSGRSIVFGDAMGFLSGTLAD